MQIQTLTKNIGNIINNGHYRGGGIKDIYKAVALSSRMSKIQNRPAFLEFSIVLEKLLCEFKQKRDDFIEWCELSYKTSEGEVDTSCLGILEDVYLKCKAMNESELLASELSFIQQTSPSSRKL